MMCYCLFKLGDKTQMRSAQKIARYYCIFCKVTQDTCASVSPLSLKCCRMNVFQMKRQATGKKGGKTSNKIKDINRTKYAQEISSEIKDVSVITMNKTCRAHQNRMVCAPGEFCRNKPVCGKSSAPRSEERTVILQRKGNSGKPTIMAGLLIAG